MYQYLEPVDDGLKMRPAGPWAAEKLYFLRSYIDVFETSMRNKWISRNYIDLLAGPGKNLVRDTGQVLLGSPLLALKVKYPFTGYYFVDADSGNTTALKERCKASSVANIHIETGDCNLLVDKIVKDLKPNERYSLNLAFLDPEGLELRWATVAKLAGILKMDLVINYPQGGLNRIMARVFQSSDVTPVDLFFGTPEWRDIYTRYKTERNISLHRELIDLYKGRLKALGYQDIRYGDGLGGDEPVMRNVKRNTPLYRLIFACKVPLGNDLWNKVNKQDIHGQRRLFDSY